MEDAFSTLWSLAAHATPISTMIFLIMWHLERIERIELRKERDALLERVLVAMHDTKDALQSLRQIIRG